MTANTVRMKMIVKAATTEKVVQGVEPAIIAWGVKIVKRAKIVRIA